MSEPDGEVRHITEAEYRDWLERAMPMLAVELTAALPQDVQDAGLHFEWTADEPQPPRQQPVFYLYCDWRASGCYRLADGAWVHVKPGCRC